jgi:hypothetical protein
MEDVIFDDAPEVVEAAAPVEAEAQPQSEAQEPAVEQQEAEQQQEVGARGVAAPKEKRARAHPRDYLGAPRSRTARSRGRAATGGVPRSQAPEPAAPAGKPALDQFQDYDSYVEAVAEWRAGEAVRAALSANEQKTQRRSASGTEQAAHGVMGQGSERPCVQALPDYDEVVGLSEVVVAPHVTDTILESDRGPEVAYYLAQHPDKAEQSTDCRPSLPPEQSAGSKHRSRSCP